MAEQPERTRQYVRVRRTRRTGHFSPLTDILSSAALGHPGRHEAGRQKINF